MLTARKRVFLPLLGCLIGMLIGFVLIHPMSMMMNHQMSHSSHQAHDISTPTIKDAFEESFTPIGLVWGSIYALVFGVIGFLIGALMAKSRTLKAAYADLAVEKGRSDKLLLNVLPRNVADELKESGASAPRKFENITVLFCDIVGFSRIASDLSPECLISELNDIFTAFDNIMEANACERIKTIGDGYLAVSGMVTKDRDSALHLVQAAVAMLDFLKGRNQTADLPWEVRIGIHSGDLVGGVVGVRKYIYDVFGDTVNCAARLEQHCDPMKINISQTTRNLVASSFPLIPRGSIETKGKGPIEMYYLVLP
jgi:class 3 adenylate cyclase